MECWRGGVEIGQQDGWWCIWWLVAPVQSHSPTVCCKNLTLVIVHGCNYMIDIIEYSSDDGGVAVMVVAIAGDGRWLSSSAVLLNDNTNLKLRRDDSLVYWTVVCTVNNVGPFFVLMIWMESIANRHITTLQVPHHLKCYKNCWILVVCYGELLALGQYLVMLCFHGRNVNLAHVVCWWRCINFLHHKMDICLPWDAVSTTNIIM